MRVSNGHQAFFYNSLLPSTIDKTLPSGDRRDRYRTWFMSVEMYKDRDSLGLSEQCS